MLEQRISANE